MALDKAALAAAIVSKLKAADPSTDEAAALAKWTAVADAIVSHIKSSAVVTASGPNPEGGVVSSTGTVS